MTEDVDLTAQHLALVRCEAGERQASHQPCDIDHLSKGDSTRVYGEIEEGTYSDFQLF